MKKKIVIKGKLPKVGTGHKPHRSGAGKHAHKNTNRLKTRANVSKKAINDE